MSALFERSVSLEEMDLMPDEEGSQERVVIRFAAQGSNDTEVVLKVCLGIDEAEKLKNCLNNLF